jgi:hypothetical protein
MVGPVLQVALEVGGRLRRVPDTAEHRREVRVTVHAGQLGQVIGPQAFRLQARRGKPFREGLLHYLPPRF